MPLQNNTSFHQWARPLLWLRPPLRKALFTFLQRLSDTADGKAIAANALNGLLKWEPRSLDAARALPAPPYSDLGTPQSEEQPRCHTQPIFITARFRTGSTLLWNIFRNIPGLTAYYEPFNERRWFDPSARGSNTDPTHRNVADYWKEYDGLTELGRHYREEWISRNLFMDANAWNPDMKRYVELLIDNAGGRPVLQFNRIDFRLPWFRRNFPSAHIVHLYRHPRDQWCSTFMSTKPFSKDGGVEDFAKHDQYYLLMWAHDLKYHFPFVNPAHVSHPYQLFYYIWKLSYICGYQYSHYSVSFERLIEEPDCQLSELCRVLDIKTPDLEHLKSLIGKPQLGRWKDYADHDWFRSHETSCETVLAEFFRTSLA